VPQFSTRRQSDKRGNIFDKPLDFATLPALEMNTMFTKQTNMHAPVNGSTAIWQRCHRLFGVAGTKS
jgi:hypothetical protein